MNKPVYLSICLLAVTSIALSNVKADTLDALLNDIQNDVIVVEKIGSCKANPYLLNASNERAIVPCTPVVAECPAGTTRLPLSNCTLKPTIYDATILNLLKQVSYPGEVVADLGKPLAKNNVNDTGIQCNSEARYFSPVGDGTGYSAFCFYNMSKLGAIPPGKSKFTIPSYLDTFSGLVNMRDGRKITISELNIAANYTCYATSYKTTARCVTLPAGFLKKLGLGNK